MVTNVAIKENEKLLDMILKEILIERYFDKDKENKRKKNSGNYILFIFNTKLFF